MSGANFLLTLSCPNQPGIVARVTAELYVYGGDILEAHQYDDSETKRFFTRIVFSLPPSSNVQDLIASFASIAKGYGMEWAIRSREERRKVVLMVSSFDHCLVDLLYRWRIGELKMDVVGIISNYPRETYKDTDFGAVPATQRGAR